MTLAIPSSLSLTVSNFITAPLFTSEPYCSVPSTSLNYTRIATLTSLPVADCGTCVSLCLTNALPPSEGRIEHCVDKLLVAANEIISVNDNNADSSNTTGTNDDRSIATFEIGPQNLLIGGIDPIHGVTHTEAHVVEEERCKGVWDGTVLLDGSLPLGKFAEYMLMGPAGDWNTKANTEVKVDPDACNCGTDEAADTEDAAPAPAQPGISNANANVFAKNKPSSKEVAKSAESGNSTAAAFNAAVAAGAAAAALSNDVEKYAMDVWANKRTEVRKGQPKGHGRPILPAEGVKALGKRSNNATDIKPPTVTGPVFSPPTGAEYMVDKGFMPRQGGAGRRFGG
ncbi:hypothetical protein G7Y79_00047g083210 [Physcia stellaris]|nr:hypothetical protein G7Y79_00047g083210 [Physcia stellaris]